MSDPKDSITVQSGYLLVEDPPDYDVVLDEQPLKLQAISAACSEAGCRKVLIRGSNANVKMSAPEVFALGELVGKLNLKIAVVTVHDASRQSENLLELTASNRGSPVRFFSTEQDAKDWLDV